MLALALFRLCLAPYLFLSCYRCGLEAFWWRTSCRISLFTGYRRVTFRLASKQCLSVVLQSFCLFVSCLFVFLVFMFVGAGFDPPVKLTCWCTPVFRRPDVCVGLVGRTDKHCTTACFVASNTKNLHNHEIPFTLIFVFLILVQTGIFLCFIFIFTYYHIIIPRIPRIKLSHNVHCIFMTDIGPRLISFYIIAF